MRVFQIAGKGRPLVSKEIQKPVPKGHEVLVRVVACGVCHSDLHAQDGSLDAGKGKKMPMPMKGLTPGHEMAGIVEEVGDKVTTVKVGEKRVVFPWVGCGKCVVCSQDEEHLCQKQRALGMGRNGGMADCVLVPHERHVIPIGDVPFELAAIYACSGLTAYSALKKLGTVSPKETIAIIGAGGVGLMALHLAVAVFNLQVVVIDISDEKLAKATEFGAKATYNPTSKEQRRPKAGIAGIVDCVGSEATTKMSLNLLRKGGRLVIVGLFGGQLEMPLVALPIRALRVEGSFAGSLVEMNELMEAARSGRVPPIPLDLRDMDTCNTALDDLRHGRVLGRAVLINKLKSPL